MPSSFASDDAAAATMVVVILGRLISAAVLATSGFFIADGWRMAVRSDADVGELLSPLFVLLSAHLAFALGLAVLVLVVVLPWRLLFGRRARSSRARWLAALVVAAGVSPAALWVTGGLLSGDSIARHEHIGLLRVAVPAVIILTTAVFVLLCDRLARIGGGAGLWSRLVVVSVLPCSLALAGLAEWWDANRFRGQYPVVHEAVALSGVLLATLALGLTLWRAGQRGRGVARLSRVTVLCAIIGFVVTAAREPTAREASLIRRFTARGSTLLTLRARFFRAAAAERVAGDPAFERERSRRAARAAASREALDRRLPNRVGWNLLWVTVDTLRADHVGAYGYERGTTPTLDALASRSCLFEQAWSQNPITHYSFQSMFYGRYPEATPLFLRGRGVERPEDDCRTLARVLRDAGYVTASFPAIPPAALSRPIYSVLGRDFELVNPGRTGDDVSVAGQTPLAEAFLADRDQRPWFLWLHYMDPHEPYVDHARFGFGSSRAGRYDSEIRAVDEGLERVFAALRRRGMADRTIVVVNGDHGESLGDHGTDFHGSTLYEEQIRVPLVVHVPGLEPRRVQLPVENVDLQVTLLTLLGLPAEPGHQGDDLCGLLMEGDGWPDPPRGVACSFIPAAPGGPLSPTVADRAAIRDGRFKLIVHRPTATMELYDLESDPQERRDIAHQNPEVARRLRAMLETVDSESRDLGGLDDGTAGLRRDLEQASTDAARLRVLQAAARREVPGIDDVLESVLARSRASAGLKRALLPIAITRDVPGALAVVRSALSDRSGWGAAGVALQALQGLVGTEREEVVRSLHDELGQLLSAPGEIALRAAVCLAWLDDSRGRRLLDAARDGRDRRRAAQATIAVARLGVGDAIAETTRRLFELRKDGGMLAQALAALAHTRHVAAITPVMDLVREPFLDHRAGRAMVAYLDALPTDEVLVPLALLRQAWDPSVADAARRALSRRPGAPSDVAMTSFGRALKDALGRVAEGGDDSLADELAKLARAIPRGGYIGVQAARAAATPARRMALAQKVLDDPAAARWHTAAHGLLRPAESHRLSLLGLEIERMTAIESGTGFLVRATVKNTGTTPIPGGRWWGGVGLQTTWRDSSGGRQAGLDVPVPLPENGLAPGAELVVPVWTEAPNDPPPTLLLDVASRCERGVVTWGDRVASVPVRRWSPTAADLSPEALEFRGAELLRSWWRPATLSMASIDAEGAAVLVATGPEPALVSPGFSDLGRPLEVTLTVEVVTPSDRATVPLSCEVAYEASPGGGGGTRLSMVVPTNEKKVLTATLPPQNGKGVRRFSIDFGGAPDLMRIHGITIRAR